MTLNKDKTLKTLSRDQIQPVIIILTLIVAILIFTAINSSFLSFSNLHSVLLTAVPVGLIAIGECAAIMSGYFDMSSGMVAAMGGLAAASVMHANGSVPLAVLAFRPVRLSRRSCRSRLWWCWLVRFAVALPKWAYPMPVGGARPSGSPAGRSPMSRSRYCPWR